MKATATTTFNDIRRPIEQHLAELNRFIDASLVSPNETMTGVMQTYISTKGKQLRPILVILSAKAFGEPNENTIRAAAAVELLHNASLIHDDVVDRSDMRHGVPTINSVWDNHIAVLIGDFFVSKALESATLTGDIRVIGVLSRLGQMLSTGEMNQICNAKAGCVERDDYFTVISYKTASLFEACVEMGAYSVGVDADNPELKQLRRFAHLLGLCFQIRDDIFDYTPSDTIGKPTGNDLLEGKVTLPLIYALNSDHPDAAEMRRLIDGRELTHEDVARLTSFAVEAGGIDKAVEMMHTLREEAATIVDNPEMLQLFDYIIGRKA